MWPIQRIVEVFAKTKKLRNAKAGSTMKSVDG
jgi:hypothetical protein